VKINHDFRSDRVLSDGTKATLRLLRPEDRDELRRGFERLSAASRYQRFLHGAATLSEPVLDYLTRTDGMDHLAVVAVTDSLDLKSDVGLGVARFIRLSDEPDVAEAAVTVVDDMQGKGLGRMLLQVLAEAARERGVRTFRAEVLSSNAPIRRILDDVGATVRRDDAETLVFDILLEPPGEIEERPDHPLRRMLRAAAESIGRLRLS
jgi:GNAT superfamily N-acetyltransferase